MKKENIKTGHFRVPLSEIFLMSVVYKIKQQLSSLTTTKKVGDPRQQPSGMTSLFYNGFTLIELLVVVLIIGILSAIALPQYQVAVEKSKVSTLLPLLSTLATAQQAYYLANNTYASNLEDLGIEIPGANLLESASRYTFSYYTTTQGQHFGISSDSGQVYAGPYLFQFNMVIQSKDTLCYAKSDSKVAVQVCKSLGVTSLENANCGLLVPGQAIACKGGAINL